MSKRKPAPVPSLAEAILAAVGESGLSTYAVAKGAGVSQPGLHRFVSGERGLTLDTADKLCRFLGLHLVKAEQPGQKPAPAPN